MENTINKNNDLSALGSVRKRLRVLHIGNIANNAYLNAKVLNESGFDCDVLCYSYYHIMANPEWEDADFIGAAGSEVRPNWNKVDLQGFKRPRWFAQGTLDTCIQYLMARRQKNRWRELLTWHVMECTRLFPRIESFLQTTSWFIENFPDSLRWIAIKRLPGNRALNPTKVQELKSGSKPKWRKDSAFEKELYRQLALSFSTSFPERADRLQQEDIDFYLGRSYKRRVRMLKSLFEQYDVIQGYGTDPILVLLSGIHPYFAFEHGTIRSIPFEEDLQGRLTALSYRMADGVIITNCDNKRAAERLHLADYRFIPHPINERWIRPGIGKLLREDLRHELGADFIIFHPARHHWDAERHPSWEKGNDILIEGLARVICEAGRKIGAVFVEWGQKIAESKALIARLGIEKNIKWVPPMHHAKMSRYIDACDLVADQFFLGAFGGIMPRALASGKPAMIYVDEEIHRWCFPEMPPVINARTAGQVYEGLMRAIDDPAWLADLAQKGQYWYQTYHSSAVVRERLIAFYNDVLNKKKDMDSSEFA